jgi:phosphatidylglycerol:prolipoprotein diacylglycerol transferase
MFPVLCEIGDIAIRTYWVMNAAGIILGFAVLLYNLRGYQKDSKRNIFLFAVLIFVPFILGARYGYAAEQFIRRMPDIDPGLFGPVSLWWGLVLATLSAFPAASVLKVNVWETADLFSISIAVGGIFARLGCLFNGCCIGMPVSPGFPLATYFSFYSYAYNIFGGIPLHPVQLYESFAWLIIFILLFIRKKYTIYRGELIIIMAFCYSFARFTIEFFRYHENPGPISIAQVFCLIIAAVSLPLWVFRKRFLSAYPAKNGARI